MSWESAASASVIEPWQSSRRAVASDHQKPVGGHRKLWTAVRPQPGYHRVGAIPKKRPQDCPQDEICRNRASLVIPMVFTNAIQQRLVHHVLRRLIQIPHH